MKLDKIINDIRQEISPNMNSLAVTNDFISINQLITISAVDDNHNDVLQQLAKSWQHYLVTNQIKPVNHLIHYIKYNQDKVNNAREKLNQLYQINFNHDNPNDYNIYAIHRKQGYDELSGQDLLNMTKDF